MIRVLVASPGDLGKERIAVREVIDELREQFRIPLEAWAWDDGTHLLDSGTDAQKQIPEPESFDVVLCLFGTRIGTPVGEDFAPAKDYWIAGSPPTGTQYEYLRASDPKRRRARDEARHISRPLVRVHALTADAANLRLKPDPRTRRRLPEQEAQYDALCAFLTCADGVGPRRVFEEFSDEVELRARVRDDLTKFLREIDHIPAIWTHGNPYPGMAPMGEERSGVFVGREDEIDDGIRRILEALERSPSVPAFLLLTGPSGVGKSSLARAGLAARFHSKRRGGRLWRRLVIRPSALGPNPAEDLRRLLADPDAAILPGLGTGVDLGAASDSSRAGEATNELGHALDAVEQDAALLLVVDQLEEALLPRDAERFTPLFRAIDLLARSGRAVVLATLAGNHRDELARQPLLATLYRPDLNSRATIELKEPDEPRLRRLIVEPMQRASGSIADDFVERLIGESRTLGNEGRGALPLLQLALAQAYRAAAARKGVDPAAPLPGVIITSDDFEGLDDTVERIATTALAAVTLPEEDKNLALWRLFRRLIQIDAQLGEVARPVPFEKLPPDLHGFARHLADGRLLVADAKGYALPHVELLRRWSRGRDWLARERRLVLLRDRLWADAEDWSKQEEPAAKRRQLDIAASLLDEAEQLRTLWPDDDLGEPLRAFLDEAIPLVRANLARQEELARSNERLSSLYLAERSESARTSDPALAVLIALEGLPKGKERPIVTEVGSALCRALARDRLRGVLGGHPIRILTAAFSPDGSRIVTASQDRTARIWDANSGAERAVLRGHDASVLTAAFSPDGDRIVTASGDKTARIWDANSGAERAVLRGHNRVVRAAAFSQDGDRIVTASDDHSAILWDAENSSESAVLRGHEGAVLTAKFSLNGRQIVTTSRDGSVSIWDANSGAERAVLRGHDASVLAAAFSPDGDRIVTASVDRTARIWDAQNGSEIAVLRGHESMIKTAAFSPDGDRIVTASDDCTARIWDAKSGSEIAVLRGHKFTVKTAAFSPDGDRIVTASVDRTARIWDPKTNAEIAIMRDHEHAVATATFSPDGRSVLTVSFDGSARIWDARLLVHRAALRGHQGGVLTATFSPDGYRIATASSDTSARIWDAQNGAEIAVMREHGGGVRTATFSPDGRRIVTASVDDTARIWDTQTGAQIAVLRGHEFSLSTAVFSPDGRRVVTASEDNSARVWDTQDGGEIAVLRGHEEMVVTACFSPDGRRIATASVDRTARIWDSKTDSTINSIVEAGPVMMAAFSPDGCRIVTASHDKSARVWDAQSCSEVAALHGHESMVRTAIFSPDGRRIVTASDDHSARVWNAQSGGEIAVLRGHESSVRTAAFSPDGCWVVTASDDHSARIWDAQNGAEFAVLRGHELGVLTAAFSPDGRRIVTGSYDHSARIWDAPDFTFSDLIAFAHASRFRELTQAERRNLYLRVPISTDLANAAVQASLRMGEAASLTSPPAEKLHALVMATALYEAAGDDVQARVAREKRAALAWRLPIADVAKVYRKAIVELYALGAIDDDYGVAASDPVDPAPPA